MCTGVVRTKVNSGACNPPPRASRWMRTCTHARARAHSHRVACMYKKTRLHKPKPLRARRRPRQGSSYRHFFSSRASSSRKKLETIALFLRAVLFRKRLIFPLFQSRTACDWLMQGEIIIVGVEYSDPFDEGVRVDGGPCDEWWHSKWVDASDRRASSSLRSGADVRVSSCGTCS